MERITINSGLGDFRLIHNITAVGTDTIAGWTVFKDASLYLMLETLAQLGALHVRYRVAFEQHAFLAKVKSLTGCSSGIHAEERVKGRWQLIGACVSHSQNGYAYSLEALPSNTEEYRFNAELLFGTMAYNDAFQQKILKNHYSQVWACLRNDSTGDWQNKNNPDSTGIHRS